MKRVRHKQDVPTTPHFAIIEFNSYWVEGDERSRTNPGHGYPGGMEYKSDYIVFTDEAEWKTEINKRMRPGYQATNFVAVRATPATVNVETTVSVNIA